MTNFVLQLPIYLHCSHLQIVVIMANASTKISFAYENGSYNVEWEIKDEICKWAL